MAVYSKGLKIKDVYYCNKKISKIYSSGRLVYQNYPKLLGNFDITINSQTGNSISGVLHFNKYLDWDSQQKIEIIRYVLSSKELETTQIGVVNFVLPSDSIIVVSGNNIGTSNKTAYVSSQEVLFLEEIITSNPDWGQSLEISSNYIQPIYGLTYSAILNNLAISSGYCIAENNRDRRIIKQEKSNYTLSSLGITDFKKYPLYIVSNGSSTDNQADIFTCDAATVQQASLFRHIGWVTYSEAGLDVEPFGVDLTSVSSFSKSAESPNIIVSGGWGVDTTGLATYVTSLNTDCSYYIKEATKERLETVKSYSTGEVNAPSPMFTRTFSWDYYSNNNQPLMTGASRAKIVATWQKYPGFSHDPVTYSIKANLYDISSMQSTENFTQDGKVGYVDLASGEGMSLVGMSCTWKATSNDVTLQGNLDLYRVYFLKQTINLYYKITKQKDNESSTIESMFVSGSAPASTPYISYVLIGVVNAETDGTLTIS